MGPAERCYLVGVELKREWNTPGETLPADEITLEQSLDELAELCRTAGLEVVGSTTQRLERVQSGTYIGSGKVADVRAAMTAVGANTCVLDDELSPSQQRALEIAFGGERTGIKVIDRTALILDIFAQHAMSREGALQVELALLEYRLPRLTRLWQHLERQSGGQGVAMRGPGETQIEVDRRLIRVRIAQIKRALEKVREERARHRSRRTASEVPNLVFVGYTSSGKSTLLNAMTSARVFADPMLFCTLDPTTRRAQLRGSELTPQVLLTDSVGFIQKLPTALVAAFRATLEAVVEADAIVHVVDRANTAWRAQAATVERVLDELGVLRSKPRIVVWNKMDRVPGAVSVALEAVERSTEAVPIVPISALHGDGLPELTQQVELLIQNMLERVECVVPYSQSALVDAFHVHGVRERLEHRPEGTYLCGRVPLRLASRLQAYAVSRGDVERDERGVDDGEQEVAGEWDEGAARMRALEWEMEAAAQTQRPAPPQSPPPVQRVYRAGQPAQVSRREEDWKELARGRHRWRPGHTAPEE